MRKFAAFVGTCSLFCKIGALSDVLLVAVETFFTVTEDCKVTTDAMSWTHVDMRKRTVFTSTAALVKEMETQWCPLRSGIMGQGTGLGSLRTIILKKVPTDCNLAGIVLIHASQTSIANTWSGKVNTIHEGHSS